MSPDAQSYAEFFRRRYAFEQSHRTLGVLTFIRAPRRARGTYLEAAVSGMTLQASMRPAAGSARVDLTAGRFQVPLTSPVFVVAPANAPCHYDIPTELDLLVAEFPMAFLQSITPNAKDIGAIHERPSNDSVVLAMMERLWQLAREPHTKLEADCFALALASLMLRASSAAAATHARGGLAPWQLRRVTEYLLEHLADDVSLEDAACLVDLSPAHFCRAFRQSTGQPPHRWRLIRRMERAAELLLRTALPVSDVAAAVGYEDSGRLAASFRRAHGLSPSEFRRKQRS